MSLHPKGAARRFSVWDEWFGAPWEVTVCGAGGRHSPDRRAGSSTEMVSVHPLVLALARARAVPQSASVRCACELESHPVARALASLDLGRPACGCEMEAHPFTFPVRSARTTSSAGREATATTRGVSLAVGGGQDFDAPCDFARSARDRAFDARARARGAAGRASEAAALAARAAASVDEATGFDVLAQAAIDAASSARSSAGFARTAARKVADAARKAQTAFTTATTYCEAAASAPTLPAAVVQVQFAARQAGVAQRHADRAEAVADSAVALADAALEYAKVAADAASAVWAEASLLVPLEVQRANDAAERARACADRAAQDELSARQFAADHPEVATYVFTVGQWAAEAADWATQAESARESALAEAAALPAAHSAEQVAGVLAGVRWAANEANDYANAACRASEQARAVLALAYGAASDARADCGLAGAPTGAAPTIADLKASPLGSGALTATRPVPLGVNGPKIYEYEAAPNVTKWGSTGAILQDLVDLGLSFFRQPTNANLLWVGLGNPITHTEELVPVVVASDGSEFAETHEIDAQLGSQTRDVIYWALHAKQWAGLRDLFERLLSTSTGAPRVVLTILTNGRTVDESDETTCFCDPLSQLGAGTMTKIAFDPGHATASAPWPDTFGVSITDTHYSTEAPTGGAADIDVSAACGACATSTDWVYSTLDTRSRYKLYYVYRLAKAAGQLLVDLRASVQAEYGVDLLDHVVAVELGNEVNRDNTFASATDAVDADGWRVDAKWWARAVREATRGFCEVLQGEGLAVDLWLPALASYTKRADEAAAQADGSVPADDQPDFVEIRTWEESFLHWLPIVAAEDGFDPTLLTWFTGQDYHVYNYKITQGPGPMARMYYEAGELSSLLAELAAEVGVDELRLSIGETGASSDAGQIASTEEREVDHRWEDPYPYVSPWLNCLSGDRPQETCGDYASKNEAQFTEEFQARDLWRRLLVACASGVEYAAWHTHIADASGEADSSDNAGFDGTGLRHDNEVSEEVPATTATRKLSWWSLQRILALLATEGAGGLGVQAAMKHVPDEPSGGCDFLDIASASDMLIIVEISPARYSDYAYVILVDPSADEDLEVNPCVRNDGLGEVWQVPTVPATTDFETSADAVATGEYAGETEAAASTWSTAMNQWVGQQQILLGALSSNAHPVLLLSATPLDFTLLTSA